MSQSDYIDRSNAEPQAYLAITVAQVGIFTVTLLGAGW
jgi:hypothetical protein